MLRMTSSRNPLGFRQPSSLLAAIYSRDSPTFLIVVPILYFADAGGNMQYVLLCRRSRFFNPLVSEPDYKCDNKYVFRSRGLEPFLHRA